MLCPKADKGASLGLLIIAFLNIKIWLVQTNRWTDRQTLICTDWFPGKGILPLTHLTPQSNSTIQHNWAKTHNQCVHDSIKLANSSRNPYVMLLRYIWYLIGV